MTEAHGVRTIYYCRDCDIYYSETFATPIAGLTTPLSRIIEVLKARNEGMGLNATARTFNVSKKSVIDWERRLANFKPTLTLYSLVHEFIHQEIKGNELYIKIDKNASQSISEGWAIVLIEHGNRFLLESHCGRKDKRRFGQALTRLAKLIEKTGSIRLLIDGERLYASILFELCHDVIRTGKQRYSRKRLPKGVRARLKSKLTKKPKH
ncbi:MAG: hypothetical protein AAFN93_16235 [Bacteroidota bacterium]